MRILIKQGDWVTKKITIVDKTKRALKNGREVLTTLAMTRKAAKM